MAPNGKAQISRVSAWYWTNAIVYPVIGDSIQSSRKVKVSYIHIERLKQEWFSEESGVDSISTHILFYNISNVPKLHLETTVFCSWIECVICKPQSSTHSFLCVYIYIKKLYIFIYMIIFILSLSLSLSLSLYIKFLYIYISSSSWHAASTDIPDPLSPCLPIIHRIRQVFRVTARIIT